MGILVSTKVFCGLSIWSYYQKGTIAVRSCFEVSSFKVNVYLQFNFGEELISVVDEPD